jgi:hypothetical protein
MNVLLFLMIKKFVYLEVLLILAGVKAALPTVAARHLSFVVIGICAARDRRAIRPTVFPNLSATMGGHCTIFDTDMGRYVHPIGSVLCFLNTMTQKHRRVMFIDEVHMVLVIGLLDLWVRTL